MEMVIEVEGWRRERLYGVLCRVHASQGGPGGICGFVDCRFGLVWFDVCSVGSAMENLGEIDIARGLMLDLHSFLHDFAAASAFLGCRA